MKQGEKINKKRERKQEEKGKRKNECEARERRERDIAIRESRYRPTQLQPSKSIHLDKKSKIFVCFLTSAYKIDPLNKYFCMHNPIQDKTLKHFILVGSFALPQSAQNLTWLHSFKKMSIKIFAIVTFLYILEYIQSNKQVSQISLYNA